MRVYGMNSRQRRFQIIDPAEQLTPEVCNRALIRADDLRVLRDNPFEDIHIKALGFYCTHYEKTFDFLQHMNPAHVTRRVAREIFALEPELFYNLPDHPAPTRTRLSSFGRWRSRASTSGMPTRPTISMS